MPYVALLLPVVLLAAVCLLARLESRVCGDVSRSERSREPVGERSGSGSGALDAPTLRLVRDRSTTHVLAASAVAASAGPELRAAS